jgi:hypothetical protein
MMIFFFVIYSMNFLAWGRIVIVAVCDAINDVVCIAFSTWFSLSCFEIDKVELAEHLNIDFMCTTLMVLIV